MKQVPIFITIPEFNMGVHYILPENIIRIASYDSYADVVFAEGGKSVKIKTLLTAQEIHERMMSIMSMKEEALWGGMLGGESDE